MGLDYKYTCPDIDRNIKTFKNDISNHLESMLDECCPLLNGKVKEDFIKEYINYIYDDFEQNFEDVRKINEDMRKEADKQIEYAKERVSDIESEITELNNKINELER